MMDRFLAYMRSPVTWADYWLMVAVIATIRACD